MQGINELPAIEQRRPEVKHIKKRETLLLKGQKEDLNASFGSDHSSVFKKANENVSGKPSVPSNRANSQRPDTLEMLPNKPLSPLKLQFKTPLAESLIVGAVSR